MVDRTEGRVPKEGYRRKEGRKTVLGGGEAYICTIHVPQNVGLVMVVAIVSWRW
jgi:hypothetical protein